MTENTTNINNAEDQANRIMDFLKGRKFFVTGGTGFLGKVMIEKILRRCPEVDTIYLLIRPKKGKDPHQRLQEVFKQAVSNNHAFHPLFVNITAKI